MALVWCPTRYEISPLSLEWMLSAAFRALGIVPQLLLGADPRVGRSLTHAAEVAEGPRRLPALSLGLSPLWRLLLLNLHPVSVQGDRWPWSGILILAPWPRHTPGSSQMGHWARLTCFWSPSVPLCPVSCAV